MIWALRGVFCGASFWLAGGRGETGVFDESFSCSLVDTPVRHRSRTNWVCHLRRNPSKVRLWWLLIRLVHVFVLAVERTGSCLVASFHTWRARTSARTGPSSILRLMTCSSPLRDFGVPPSSHFSTSSTGLQLAHLACSRSTYTLCPFTVPNIKAATYLPLRHSHLPI